jgi:putative tryptophan/tyrosine transport system substrate-binding protein
MLRSVTRRSAARGRASRATLWPALALSLLAALAAPSRAGDAKSNGEGLEREFGFLEAEDVEKIPLEVVSRGPAIVAGQAPAIVDVITAEEIRTSGARTLAELLSQRVGIDVSIDRVVPRGLNTTASTAGITLVNHRTLLLIDGRPTNGLFFGDFLAGRELPLEYIERVEIIRGPGSALYGTNAMAGVINVVTKDYADEPGPGVIGEYGTQSTRRVDAFAGGGIPERNGNFFLRYFASGGANRPDRNDNLRQYFGFARGQLGPLTLEAEGLDFARQEPGAEGAPTPDDHINRSRYSFGGRVDHPIDEQFRVTGRIYSNLYETRLQAVAGTPPRSAYDERRVGEELALNYRPFDWLSVTLGGEVREENGEIRLAQCSPTSGTTLVPNGCLLHQNVYAAFLEDQIGLPYGFNLTGGFRYDDVSTSGGRLNPRVNLLWKPDQRTTLKVGYGEAFRAPSFFELRGAQQFGSGTFVLGNTRLQPEVVRTIEGELTRAFARQLNVRVSAFYTRGDDLISQASATDLIGLCASGLVSPALAFLCQVINGLPLLPPLTRTNISFVNATRVEVVGLEAGAGGLIRDLPIPGELSYGLNYTFQDTQSRSPGIPGQPDLPLAPRHKANVLFDYRPIPQLSIFSHTRVVGRQFADGAEKQSLERYVNENVNLVYRLNRGLQVGVGLYNVGGDGRHEALGVPREPRTVLGQIAYRFVPAPALPKLPKPSEEPAELGEARAAVERAREAGAERLGTTSYREALAELATAEYLQRSGATREQVGAAAAHAKQAADLARESALAAAVPTPAASPIATVPAPPTAERTPAIEHPPHAKRTAAPGPAAGTPAGTPGPRTVATAPTPSPTSTARPTATATPRPTATPTVNLSALRVLLLQSDADVVVYRDTAARLAAALPGRVELRDVHGDRQQAVEAARQTEADIVVAVGSLAATVAREEITDRPMIFCAVLNPERYNLTGPNVAGVSFEVSAAAQLERLHAALPGATRIGVIYDPQKSGAMVAEAERAAARLGVQLVKAVAKQPRDVDPVFRSLKRDIDVLWVIPDSTVVTRESFEVLALGAAESRIPFVAFSEAFARQGALLAFYPDAGAVGDQCAALAVSVLRGDVKPSQVGIRAPERFRVAVNRRVEDQLGLNLDARLRPDVEIR